MGSSAGAVTIDVPVVGVAFWAESSLPEHEARASEIKAAARTGSARRIVGAPKCVAVATDCTASYPVCE